METLVGSSMARTVHRYDPMFLMHRFDLSLLISLTLPLILIGGLSCAGLAQTPEELAHRTAQILQERCAECHGRDVRRPKGRFGYVEDLAQVRESYVQEPTLDGADLWYWLTEAKDLMPPESSESGTLTVDELAVIRCWILAGAPTPQGLPEGAPRKSASRGDPSFLSRFHPLIVHFPIALTLFAAFMECMIILGCGGFRSAVRLTTLLAAGSAGGAALSGSQLAEGMGTRISEHATLGFITLGVLTLTIIGQHLAAKHPHWLWPSRIFLILSAVAVSITGHLGGVLVWPSHWN